MYEKFGYYKFFLNFILFALERSIYQYYGSIGQMKTYCETTQTNHEINEDLCLFMFVQKQWRPLKEAPENKQAQDINKIDEKYVYKSQFLVNSHKNWIYDL